MTRISKNNYNGSSLSTGRNFVDNTRGMIPGLTKGETYGTGEEIKKQVEMTGGLPSVKDLPQPKIDRPTEKQEESIMTGAQTIQPGNFTVSNSQGNIIARPGTQYKNSDMASAYVQSDFNDDILNILIRTT
jgi:hypothetical protein